MSLSVIQPKNCEGSWTYLTSYHFLTTCTEFVEVNQVNNKELELDYLRMVKMFSVKASKCH